MTFRINAENIQENLTDNYIIIDSEFFKKHKLKAVSEIKIKDILDKTINVRITNVTNQKLSIKFENCSFGGFFLDNCTFDKLHFSNVEVSEHTDARIKPYNLYIDKTNLNSIWVSVCKFYQGFLIRNNSEIKYINVIDSLVENSLTIVNTKAETLQIESSQLEYLKIERSNFPNQNSVMEIEQINIFRTTINLGFEIWEVKFKKISISKIIVNKSTDISTHQQDIRISTPDDYTGIENIEIEESNLERNLVISIDSIQKFDIHKNTFDNFRINFWKISELNFSTNTIKNDFFLGFKKRKKNISKFNFSDNTFNNRFYISDIIFKDEFYLTSSTFNKYPSFIENCRFKQNCKTDFEFSNFNNLIFQDINFENVSFKNFDVTNSTFKNCQWKVEEHFFYNNFILFDDLENQSDKIEDLIQIKKVYSTLKTNFQDKNDFINASRFYISEQNIKRKITLINKSYLEYLILTIHKCLSVYGESITKIICVLFLSLIVFSNIYFFSGFKSGNTTINHALELDIENFKKSLKDFIKALILSIKNIVPFPLNNKFFINTDEKFSITQIFELIQKIFNFVILASFTETFVKYLKK
jgi:uncharacterized protein YjbI with pentapeptide repeats